MQPKAFLGASVFCLLLLFLQFQADNHIRFDSSDLTGNKTTSSNSSTDCTSEVPTNFTIKKRNVRHPENPLDYNIIIIHYHKSGHAIANNFLKLLGREGRSIGLGTKHDEKGKKRKRIRGIKKRTHDMNTECPRGHYPCGYALILTSPDFFCSNDVLDEVLEPTGPNPYRMKMNAQKIAYGTKIIHMVRDPFEMALSNYFYHSQSPTPEDWVKKDHNPCDTEYYDRGRHTNTTNLDLIMPTLSTMARSQIDAVESLCHSLFQNPNREKASLYDYLLNLEGIDGLRLSTSRQIISGGGKIEHAGGDLLRMTNNAVKLHQLINHNGGNRTFRSLQVMTTFMPQWVDDPYNTTMAALDFVLGDKLPQKRKQAVAIEYQQKYEEKVSSENIHITSTKDFVHEKKKEMMSLLKGDRVLAPVLNEMQELLRLNS